MWRIISTRARPIRMTRYPACKARLLKPLSNRFHRKVLPKSLRLREIEPPQLDTSHGSISSYAQDHPKLTTRWDFENVHDLPAIFHYWANRHLLPKFEFLGTRNPNDFYLGYIDRMANSGASRRPFRGPDTECWRGQL